MNETTPTAVTAAIEAAITALELDTSCLDELKQEDGTSLKYEIDDLLLYALRHLKYARTRILEA